MDRANKLSISLACLVCWFADLSPLSAFETSPLRIVEPRCEHLRDPLGIDVPEPRLSWQLQPTNPQLRDLKQTAYHILVSSSLERLKKNEGDIWDSGKVESEQSILVPYRGRRLESFDRCWWKVRVWGETGDPSAWSGQSRWTMGPLDKEAWRDAAWIGLDEAQDAGMDTSFFLSAKWLWYPEGKPAHDAPVATRYFRKSIELPDNRRVTRAIAFFAGDDQCVFIVNGVQVGVGRGHPNLIGVEIGSHLREGKNHLAAAATNMQADVPNNPGGWIGAVRIEFETGEPMLIVSDQSWRCRQMIQPGWETAAIDGDEWQMAQELGQAGMAPWGAPWPKRWFSEHRRLPARYIRHEFKGHGVPIVNATASVCGLGFFDLYVNGMRIGDQLMTPALTDYNQRALYVTLDISRHLRPLGNAFGVVLSNGRFFAPRSQVPMPMANYGYPKLLMIVRIEYADGTVQFVTSQPDWKLTTDGPIRSSSEFDGEEYDATRDFKGWASTNFDDSAWINAKRVDAPGGRLEAQMLEPIRVTKELVPQQILQSKPGVWMLDFGQAFYGVVRVRANGPRGTRITMRTSFNVTPDGLLNSVNDRSALNTDVFTLSGKPNSDDFLSEEWHPRFRGNATRWVQVEGFPGTPTYANFTGLVTHTAHATGGIFACSNKLINRIYGNAVWGTRMQNRSVPMEPDRDERMPWSGHPAKTSESEGWAYNVARFYAHFLHNYRVGQASDGSLQEILPPYWQFNSRDIVWPSVATIIPDWYYDFYGDDQPLRDNYEMMKRFVEYHRQTNLKPDGTLDHCTYGDWVDTSSIGSNARNFGATSRPLIGTAYFYRNCCIIQRAARLLGKPEDEKQYGELAERVRQGFNQRFFDEKTATYTSETQCSYLLPLAFGLVPEQHRQRVVDNLVDDIVNKHQGHTTVGLIGMQWLMPTLSKLGHTAAAYRIATRTERPSWGYMIDKGATTIWERWDTDTQDGGMNGESQKILSGNFEAWCYQALAGINYDPEHPGFKHIILRPQPVGDLKWAKATFNSPYGHVESNWKIEGDTFIWKVVVPPNTTATVHLPSPGSQPTTIGSGQYEFRCKLAIGN